MQYPLKYILENVHSMGEKFRADMTALIKKSEGNHEEEVGMGDFGWARSG